MTTKGICLGMVVVCLLCGVGLLAQQSDGGSGVSVTPSAEASPQVSGQVPRLVRFDGVVKDRFGRLQSGTVGLTFSIHELQEGGTPLWVETQTVQLDDQGHYTVLLGATQPDGLPLDLFTSGGTRWLGVQPELPGVGEQPRVLLVGVPYALEAANAETLNGKPASAFVLTESPTGPNAAADSSASAPAPRTAARPSTRPRPQQACSAVTSDGTATANSIAVFTTPCNIENSVIVQNGTVVGIGGLAIDSSTGLVTFVMGQTFPGIAGGGTVTSVNTGMGLIGGPITSSGTLSIDPTVVPQLGASSNTFAGTVSAAGDVLPPISTATTTQAFGSNPLDFQASVFNTGLGAPATYDFRWQAEPQGNDSNNTGASLNLLYGVPGDMSETGLSVARNGIITFAPGQTFGGGGGGTITGVTAGTDLTGGGTSGNVTLNLNTTATDGRYARLSAANTFTGNQSVTGTITATGTVTAPLFNGNAGAIEGKPVATAAPANGQVLAYNSTAGSWGPVTPAGGGTITGVTAGTDLTGGGTSGNVTLNLNTTATDGRYARLSAANTFTGNQSVTGTIAATGTVTAPLFNGNAGAIEGKPVATAAPTNGQVLAYNSTAGSWGPVTPAGGGTITGVTAGTDLTGGGTSGNVTLNLNTTATDGRYARLSAANTFAGNQRITGTLTASGSVTAPLFNGNAGAIEGKPVEIATPKNGQVLAYSGTTGKWGPATPVGGGTITGVKAGTDLTGGGTSGDVTLNLNTTSTDGRYARLSADNTFSASQTVAGNIKATGSVSGKTGNFTGTLSTGGDVNIKSPATGTTALTVEATDTANKLTRGLLVQNFTKQKGAVIVTASSPNIGGSCEIIAGGHLICSGTKSAAVPLEDGRKVALYAVEAAENWFEDAGSGKLLNGGATVTLESTFAQTVNTGTEYHVFLTPEGDCEGLYVTNKTLTGFEVRELHGGHSNIAFDYRIMARRKGYENIRLADKTKQLDLPEAKLGVP